MLPLHCACEYRACAEIFDILLVSTVQSLFLEVPCWCTLNILQVINIFEIIWRDGLQMQALEFDHSRNCQEVVGSSEWHSKGLPHVPAARDKNWLKLANTLVEVGNFGSESNDFSRVMFVGRGMSGKSRLVQALSSPSFKASAIKRENRSIGSRLMPFQLMAADGRCLEVLFQDCAGQRVAYISHCIHVVDDCLYVLVWSPFQEGFNNKLASIDDICAPLFEWLNILASHAPHSQIALVGTHLDTPIDCDEPAFFVRSYRKLYADIAFQVESHVDAEVSRLNQLLDHEQNELQKKISDTCDVVAELYKLCSDSIKARSRDVIDRQFWENYATDENVPRRDRLIAQRIVSNLEQIGIISRRLDVLERSYGGSTNRLKIQLTAHVDSASGANVEDLILKLGAVVGNLSHVNKQVPKRWKTIRQKFPALAAIANQSPVLSKSQVIRALRQLDWALDNMSDNQLWDGVMFWASLGVVLERNEQVFYDGTQVLEVIRPLVHHLPSTLLNDDVDSHQLLLASSKTLGPNREVAQKLLLNLEQNSELSLELLYHFTAWSHMNPVQHEAMLSFLLDSSLLCPMLNDTSKFMVTMRMSKDDAASIPEKDQDASRDHADDATSAQEKRKSTSQEAASSEKLDEVCANAPYNVAYLLPLRFIALVPKLMTAIVAFQPVRVQVVVEQCCDEGIVLSRKDSNLVLKVIPMFAAREHSNFKALPTIKLPDQGKYGCVLHVAGNDVGLLHIAALCIESVFSSGKLGCRSECWCLRDCNTNAWVEFGNRSSAFSVAISLLDAIRQDWSTVVCARNNWRFGDLFFQPRHRVILVHNDGDGCCEFVHRLQKHIEQLSFTTAVCSNCAEQNSLNRISHSFKECGVIVICVTPQTFLNIVSVQALHWALQLKRQQLRHVVIIPAHPAMIKQNRDSIIRSNLVFANNQAWQLHSIALRVLLSLTSIDDPTPSYVALRPWVSDEQADGWEEQTKLSQSAARVSLRTTGFDGTGLVNRMIFDTPEFINHIVGIRHCTLSPELFDGEIEPPAKTVDWSHVPDGLVDVYPEDVRARYLGLLQSAASDQCIRQRNFETIRIQLERSQPVFIAIPTVAPDDVTPSTCGVFGKVFKDGEVYFRKWMHEPKPCYDFIGKHCSKICICDHCLPVRAVCMEPQHHFMLLPWMELRDRLDQVMLQPARLPLGERVRIIRRIAIALRAYHSNGLTHGDISPSKIFLDSTNAPHLCFSGSTACDLAGKLRWSSPECVAGASIASGSDIWSLGVLAYSLLFMKTPFGESATESSIRQALGPASSSWPPFDVTASTPLPYVLPEDTQALLERCWHRDPASRISVHDLIDKLASLYPTQLQLQPLPLPSPSPGYQTMPLFDMLRAALPAATTDADITAEIEVAAAKCRQSSARRVMQQRNITAIEGQSICIYTSDLIYKDFSAAFRSLKASEIQRWSNYASTLHSALGKLEAPQHQLQQSPGFVVV
jgi:serine/threonine protein kinase